MTTFRPCASPACTACQEVRRLREVVAARSMACAGYPSPNGPGCVRCGEDAHDLAERLRCEVGRLCDEADGWHVYETRDIGDAFIADAVRDLVADLRAALDGGAL